jgi:hypothetical protein
MPHQNQHGGVLSQRGAGQRADDRQRDEQQDQGAINRRGVTEVERGSGL